MGPGDGIQNQRLLDLPTTIETADQISNQSFIIRQSSLTPHTAARQAINSQNGKILSLILINIYICAFSSSRMGHLYIFEVQTIEATSNYRFFMFR